MNLNSRGRGQVERRSKLRFQVLAVASAQARTLPLPGSLFCSLEAHVPASEEFRKSSMARLAKGDQTCITGVLRSSVY